LSLWGTNGILASTYGLNFCHDFLKLFWKIEKTDWLHGNIDFFQLVPGNKNYAQISSKQGMGATKKIQNLNFFLIDYIFVYIESFDPFHLDLLWESYGQSCFWKSNLEDSFLNAIFTIKQTKIPYGLVCFLEQSHHWICTF